jgi:magnesium-transporting ATPase (P-type)
MINKKVIFLILIIIFFLLTITIYAQQNQNNFETKIEIKIQGKINELQKTKIQSLLKYFEDQNPRLKIDSKTLEEKSERFEETRKREGEIKKKENKVQKYHFKPISISASIIIFLLSLLIIIKKEKRHAINLVNNIFMGFIFLFSAISGVLLIYGYKFSDFDLKFWHVIISVILLFAIIFHFIIHWKIWLSYFKKIFRIRS